MPIPFMSIFSSEKPADPSEKIFTYISNHQNFEINSDNLKIIIDCTKELESKLLKLQNIDAHIISGFGIGATALTFSSLVPFGMMVAIAGFSYSAYYVGKREDLSKEYRVALSDAVACLRWTLGKIANKDNKDAILSNKELQNLFDVLSPLMSEEQIRAAIDDAVEEGFIAKAAAQELDLFGRKLNKQEKALAYGMYGYEQGSVLDIGKGLWYLMCQAFNLIIQSIKGLFKGTETTNADPSDTANTNDTNTNLTNAP